MLSLRNINIGCEVDLGLNRLGFIRYGDRIDLVLPRHKAGLQHDLHACDGVPRRCECNMLDLGVWSFGGWSIVELASLMPLLVKEHHLLDRTRIKILRNGDLLDL